MRRVVPTYGSNWYSQWQDFVRVGRVMAICQAPRVLARAGTMLSVRPCGLNRGSWQDNNSTVETSGQAEAAAEASGSNNLAWIPRR